MVEVVIAEFEIDGLTPPALSVLKAAVKYAEARKNIRLHSIPIAVFCNLAGLPSLTFNEMRVLLSQATKAIAVIELMNTAASDQEDDEDYKSWPVFSEVKLVGSQFIFEICPETWDERLISNLSSLSLRSTRDANKTT